MVAIMLKDGYFYNNSFSASQFFQVKEATLLQNLVQQVQANCRIATAAQVGYYSLCGMLLRLRQLYKWEQGLLPWQEGHPQEVLAWIAQQEEAWHDLAETDLRDLQWQSRRLNPFAITEVNQLVAAEGLAYGAGFTHGLAPMCFLGELWEREQRYGLTILILGPELARDMDAAPALRQGETIYLRTEPLAFYLWDHLADPTKQNNIFFKVALAARGLDPAAWLQQPDRYAAAFQEMLKAQGEAMVCHEIGEALEPTLQDTLPAIVHRLPHSKVERYVRALKDALADLNEWGRLVHIVQRRDLPQLALLLAWRPGFYPYLIPELELAFWELQRTRDWGVIEATRQIALKRLRQTAQELECLWAEMGDRDKAWQQRQVEQRFICPLGL
jgi:hypothetical protein